MSNSVFNRYRELRFSTVVNEHRKHPNASIQLPKRSTTGAGAYDFFSPADYVIKPGQQVMIWTDVKAIMPQGLMLLLNVRSSMGKSRLSLANTQGWVDSDYANNPGNDGNIGILLENNDVVAHTIRAGDRVAQGMFVKFYVTEDDFVDKEREGGFGSTGQ